MMVERKGRGGSGSNKGGTQWADCFIASTLTDARRLHSMRKCAHMTLVRSLRERDKAR